MPPLGEVNSPHNSNWTATANFTSLTRKGAGQHVRKLTGKALSGVVVFVVALFLALGCAKAETIVYTNFGAGMSFDTNPANSYFVTGASFPSTCPPSNASCVTAEVLGVQFTPTANYVFDDAQVPVFLEGGTNSLGVYLQQDSSGLPGSIISEFQVSNEMTSSPAVLTVGEGQSGVSLLAGSSAPDLTAGTPYWLVLAAGAADTKAAWAGNSIGDIATGVLACQISSTGGMMCPSAPTPSNFAFNTTPNSSVPNWSWIPGSITTTQQGSPPTTVGTFYRTAFQIDGSVATPPSPVPEPPSMVLMGLGLIAIFLIVVGRRPVPLQ
ncbi:MAG: PEP-CTERM sorting domain-containing protein [Terriglobia bacterium]